MRVLGVGNAYPPHHLGGYEVIWRGVTRRLRADGHETRVLTTDYADPRVPADAADDPDVHRELDWYWREHQWRALGLRERLTLERRNAAVFDRHVSEFRPDVIAWWPVGGLSLSMIERARRGGRARIPAVFFVLDYWLSYAPRHDLWMRMWSRLRPLAPVAQRITGIPTRVRFADAGRWVFCSETARANTLAVGLRTANTAVISPGVQRALLEVPREPEPPPWRWRLLYLGRVVEQKGVETAIESLALLPAEATLAIVGEGDGAYRARLEQLAVRLGVSARVRFHPPCPRERLPEVYRDADAVVFPVQWPEPWGLVPLEAMALGRPVIATGRGGSGEYLAESQNSVLFAAGDSEDLAAAATRLAGDPQLRARVRAGGYETAARLNEDEFNRLAVAELVAACAGG